jgi:hypothetical protein
MTIQNDMEIDDAWYRSTYPHIAQEMLETGINSPTDHWKHLGQKNGLIPNFFSLRLNNSDRCSILFNKSVFNDCSKYSYLYKININEFMMTKMHGAKNVIEYFTAASHESCGEIHYQLMLSFYLYKQGKKAKSKEIIDKINFHEDINEFHYYFLYFMLSLLGSLNEAKSIAVQICNKFPQKLAVWELYKPPIIYSARRAKHAAPTCIRLVFFSPFLTKISAFIESNKIIGSSSYQDLSDFGIHSLYSIVNYNNAFDFRFKLDPDDGDEYFFTITFNVVCKFINDGHVLFKRDVKIPFDATESYTAPPND